ncbi:MAG: O-antigen ligase family protein, partial [Anaerolineae bacterium]|nr:O-antigen ligase family protein [Anaerolineae bacterium]
MRFTTLLLCAVLITAAHTFRGFLWQADTPSPVLRELSSVVIFLIDFPLMALLFSSVVRLLSQDSLSDTLTLLIKRVGGAAWIGLLLWVMVGYVWARETILVQYMVFRLVLEINLLVVTADLVRQGKERPLLYVLLFGAGIQSMIAIAQVINGGALGLEALGELQADEIYHTGSRLRGYGLSVNPNNLSGYLLIALFVWFKMDTALPCPYYGLWGFLLLAGLLATGSSTAIISLILVSIFYFFPFKQRFLFLVTALLIVLGSLLWRESSVGVTDRLFFAYDDTLEVLRQSPILGVGADNLMVEISHQNPFSLEVLLPAHNAFLMIWAELGLPGLILVLMTFWGIAGRDRAVSYPYCLLAIGLVMLFDFYFWGDFRMRVMWFWVVGLA